MTNAELFLIFIIGLCLGSLVLVDYLFSRYMNEVLK